MMMMRVHVALSLILVMPLGVVSFVIPSPTATRRNSARRSTSTSLFSSPDEICDVLVLGAGPTGRAISSLLDQKSLKVCLADANYDRRFVPNYGVWQDEWDAVVAKYASQGVDLTGGKNGKALSREWIQTDCFFGGSFDKPMNERLTVDRPYCQVDKDALRTSLSGGNVKVLKGNHQSKATSVNLYSPAGSLVHDEEGTTTILQDSNGKKVTVRSKLVIDTTGHESTLVLRDARAPANAPPGFQIAYGCLCEINEKDPNAVTFGPYDKEAMTLFDYRTDHLESNPEWEKRAIKEPTFMYVMPIEGNQVFFEETSLVARPGVSFQECKDRCMKRLEFLGIDVASVLEEEYCYIPMGGSLPLKDQRVIGLGGSAAMVHPSTGYHLCRMLMGAANVANAVNEELKLPVPNLDKAAASAYHAIWSPETIRQRNFAVFGGEFLMEQDVVGLRGFFDGFFKLPLELWAGFLAGWPGLPNNDKHESWLGRMWFGLSFIVRIPPPVALKMAQAIVGYSLSEGAPLPQSVTPFLGAPPSYEYKEFLQENVGDSAAKEEAKKMIMGSTLKEEVPVAFEEQVTASSTVTEEVPVDVEGQVTASSTVTEEVPDSAFE